MLQYTTSLERTSFVLSYSPRTDACRCQTSKRVPRCNFSNDDTSRRPAETIRSSFCRSTLCNANLRRTSTVISITRAVHRISCVSLEDTCQTVGAEHCTAETRSHARTRFSALTMLIVIKKQRCRSWLWFKPSVLVFNAGNQFIYPLLASASLGVDGIKDKVDHEQYNAHSHSNYAA